MGLRIKFNLVLLLAFLSGLALAAYQSDCFLKDNAREEVIQISRIMMESAMGARKYTSEHIKPLLALQMKRKFLKETVSAFAAKQSFEALRPQYPDYRYKEVALNPTIVEDFPSDWEAAIIQEFRNNDELKEKIVERDSPTGQMLNLARPIVVLEGCLTCHGKPEDAPKTMTDLYGVNNNGFGWQIGETIGAQVVTVPMSVPLDRARETFKRFMILLSGVFLWLLVLLNILLHFVVIQPVARMARIADEVSLGKPDVPVYVKTGADEISSLSRSFNRMRLSLEKAMNMLGE